MELIEEDVFKFGTGTNTIIFLIHTVIFIVRVASRDGVGLLFWKELRSVRMMKKKRWVPGTYNQ